MELVNARLLQWGVPCFLEHDRLDGYFGDALEDELAVWGGTREGAGIEGGKGEEMRERRVNI